MWCILDFVEDPPEGGGHQRTSRAIDADGARVAHIGHLWRWIAAMVEDFGCENGGCFKERGLYHRHKEVWMSLFLELKEMWG